MNSEHPRYLVETDWLEARLDDPELRILDCMVFIHATGLESGRQKWAEGHIPGSGFADLVTDLSDPDVWNFRRCDHTGAAPGAWRGWTSRDAVLIFSPPFHPNEESP